MSEDLGMWHEMFLRGRTSRWLLWAPLAMTGAVWLSSANALVADDSLFYLVVARRYILEGWLSFSGHFATNGFHPLWEALLVAYGSLLAAFSPALLDSFYWPLPLSLALFAAGYGFLLRALSDFGYVARLAGLLIVAVFFSISAILYSEGVLLFTLLAILLWGMAKGHFLRSRGPWLLGALCALIGLARLDCVLVIVPVLLLFGWQSRSWRAPLKAGFVFALLCSPYLLANAVYFGGLTPVSGWLKSSFPHPYLDKEIATLSHLSRGFLGYSLLWGAIPSGLCSLLLGYRFRRAGRADTPNGLWGLALALLLGHLGQAFYTILFTNGPTLWAWYYVVPLFTLALVTTLFLDHYPPKWSPLLLTLGGVSGLALALRLALAMSASWPAQPFEDLRSSPLALALHEFLRAEGGQGQVLLVSDSPGEIAFRFPQESVIAADLLTANRPLYQALKAGPNAFWTLERELRKGGRHLDFVVHVGSGWLNGEANWQRLSWADPRHQHTQQLGAVLLPKPCYENKAAQLRIWRFSEIMARNGVLLP